MLQYKEILQNLEMIDAEVNLPGITNHQKVKKLLRKLITKLKKVENVDIVMGMIVKEDKSYDVVRQSDSNEILH